MFQVTKYDKCEKTQLPVLLNWLRYLKERGHKAEIRCKQIPETDHGKTWMRHHFAVYRDGKEA